MKKFSFTIHIVDLNASHNGFEDRLYEAGCDDALVCSINKNLYLEFSRESKTLDLAIESAVNNIKKANAKVIRIDVE
ncbi:hypothetical protein [Acinetobacter sp. YH16042]|uniref:hypothetical protein n=1 Tax=Acinetobacter sp. YH16042 TaxID=2601186 RepID=UPI0015D2A9D0|nr:hypothetical protein [Acinetobacter sp. YH16042]